MAARMNQALRWLVGLFASLMLPLIAAALGWNDPWPVIVGSALFGALCLWNINVDYREWINDTGAGWTVAVWLERNLTLATIGIAVIAGAAALVRWSSAENLQVGIAYALGLWLAGAVPVVQVVRARLADIADAFPATIAWFLNAVLIVGATVLPAWIITSWERSGLLLGAVGGGVWLAFEVARRLIGPLPWLVGVGAFSMLLPAAFVLFADADRIRWQLLLLLPLGLALVSARQRSASPVDVLANRKGLAPDRPDRWRFTALAGLLVLIAGFVWWAVVIGDDVSRTLVFAGVFAAMLFGASLVTHGEGLVMLVLLGLLVMWGVQDHTGAPASVPANDSPSVLAAFGDSYMSGEGIGTFFAGTNTAGRRDLAIGGENECRRSADAYVLLVAPALDLDPAFYACSGALAVTGDFDPDAEADELDENSVYGQLLRWEAERGTDNDPELVLMSLGGNDAGFARIGAACFLPGSCDDALDNSSVPALEGVTQRVAIVLTKAREMFPTSPMAVIAYPQMFGPDADRCASQVPFDQDETLALTRFVEALNSAVGEAVDAVGGGQIVHFTGSVSAFEGARFCEISDDGRTLVSPDAMRALSLQPPEGDDLFDRLEPAKIVHNTFHPTRAGHARIADVLRPFLVDKCHLLEASAGCGPVPIPAEEISPVVMVEEEAEAVDDAPTGACGELDTFNQCTIIQSLRLVLVPLVLMVLAGLLLAMAARQRLDRRGAARPVEAQGDLRSTGHRSAL